MSETHAERWTVLRSLLSNPFTPKHWKQLEVALQEWPPGEEAALAHTYVYEFIEQLPEPNVENPSLYGLWKAISVVEESGTLDVEADIDYDVKEAEDFFDYQIQEEETSCQVEEQLHFYLELCPDGRLRETELCTYPLTVSLQDWEYEILDQEDLQDREEQAGSQPLGSVWKIAGYEHSLEFDEEGFLYSDNLRTQTQAKSLILHMNDPDEYVEDKATLLSPTRMKRSGYVLWDGVYYTHRVIHYRKIAEFRE